MKINRQILWYSCALALGAIACSQPQQQTASAPALSSAELEEMADNPGNPIITHKYTADPATLVYNDTVYLYAGHDEAPARHNGYVLNEWLIFKSTDLKNWEEHPVPFRVEEFEWPPEVPGLLKRLRKTVNFIGMLLPTMNLPKDLVWELLCPTVLLVRLKMLLVHLS